MGEALKKPVTILSVVGLTIMLLISSSGCAARNKELIIGSTTSIVDSGLMDVLAEDFSDRYGYTVKPISVGSGEALEMGSRGDCDLVIVHSKQSELKFVEDGFGINRTEFMYNQFVLVGPADDPASVGQLGSMEDCFKKIAETGSLFVSRGDDSGTHKKELAIWESINIKPEGEWYIETGQGMADTLIIAGEKKAYVLTDMGTYLTLKDKIELSVLRQGDEILKNVYSAIAINPKKFKSVNFEAADKFIKYLVSDETREIINNFGKEEYSEQLFYTIP
jgi:tungstate transport system substrate-binding protein